MGKHLAFFLKTLAVGLAGMTILLGAGCALMQTYPPGSKVSFELKVECSQDDEWVFDRFREATCGQFREFARRFQDFVFLEVPDSSKNPSHQVVVHINEVALSQPSGMATRPATKPASPTITDQEISFELPGDGTFLYYHANKDELKSLKMTQATAHLHCRIEYWHEKGLTSKDGYVSLPLSGSAPEQRQLVLLLSRVRDALEEMIPFIRME